MGRPLFTICRRGINLSVKILDIEPLYYARDKGTGVALVRAEDRPGKGELVDFMRGHGVIRPGAVVPVHWRQIWDYSKGFDQIPGLFRWPQFIEWMEDWPEDESGFKRRWKKLFGMPGDDEADGVIVVWEEK